MRQNDICVNVSHGQMGVEAPTDIPQAPKVVPQKGARMGVVNGKTRQNVYKSNTAVPLQGHAHIGPWQHPGRKLVIVDSSYSNSYLGGGEHRPSQRHAKTQPE